MPTFDEDPSFLEDPLEIMEFSESLGRGGSIHAEVAPEESAFDYSRDSVAREAPDAGAQNTGSEADTQQLTE